MKINDYSKSREEYLRACKVIPSGIYGHQGPAEGCYIPVEAWPLFSSRAPGSYFWDVDGNRMIDYMCGYGPNVLGYHDPDVDAAAAKQRQLEDCVTIPSTKMIDFAELLVETVASADWAFFAKNGNDVTTLAVMTARVVTSLPFLAKKAQSAQATVSTSSSAKSIILVEGMVTQSSFSRCLRAASSTSGS